MIGERPEEEEVEEVATAGRFEKFNRNEIPPFRHYAVSSVVSGCLRLLANAAALSSVS